MTFEQELISNRDEFFNLIRINTKVDLKSVLKKIEYSFSEGVYDEELIKMMLSEKLSSNDLYKTSTYVSLYALSYFTQNPKEFDIRKLNYCLIDFWQIVEEEGLDNKRSRVLQFVILNLVYILQQSLFIAKDESVAFQMDFYERSNQGAKIKAIGTAASLLTATIAGAKIGSGLSAQDFSKVGKGAVLYGSTSVMDKLTDSLSDTAPDGKDFDLVMRKILEVASESMFSIMKLIAAHGKLAGTLRMDIFRSFCSGYSQDINHLHYGLTEEGFAELSSINGQIIETMYSKFDIQELISGNFYCLYFPDLPNQDSVEVYKEGDFEHFPAGNFQIINNYFSKKIFSNAEVLDESLHYTYERFLDGYRTATLKYPLQKLRDKNNEVYLISLINEVNIAAERGVTISENNSSDCFVVTASYPDNYQIVEEFRVYRDEVIKKWTWGNLLIRIYYKIGPLLAVLPRNSSKAKYSSRKFLKWYYNRFIK